VTTSDRDVSTATPLPWRVSPWGSPQIVGAIVSAARNHGDIGGFGLVCFVGGVTNAVSLVVLKRRG
jgi:hypothetical protein